MPSYWTDGGCYFVSYITGPAHVLLGLRLWRGGGEAHVAMTRRPAVGQCGCGPVDEEQVRGAVLTGITSANTALETDWQPTEIVYVEDDTPRYSLYSHCAALIVERVNGGWGSRP